VVVRVDPPSSVKHVTTDPRLPAARAVIERLLGDDAERVATITVEEVPSDGGFDLVVSPIKPGAATLRVSAHAADDEEVVVEFGRTHVYLWAPDVESIVSEVEHIAEAVFAGRFVEAGWAEDAFVRLTAADGTVQGMGRAHWPWPWRWRRTTTYAAYGHPAP
jgi:hypothetical protein